MDGLHDLYLEALLERCLRCGVAGEVFEVVPEDFQEIVHELKERRRLDARRRERARRRRDRLRRLRA